MKKIISSKHLVNDEFQIQPMSIYDRRKQIKSLNINKPLGPSNFQAWAPKDASDVLALVGLVVNLQHLCQSNEGIYRGEM